MPSNFEIAVIILLLVNIGLSVYMKIVLSQENFPDDQQESDQDIIYQVYQATRQKPTTKPPLNTPTPTSYKPTPAARTY